MWYMYVWVFMFYVLSGVIFLKYLHKYSDSYGEHTTSILLLERKEIFGDLSYITFSIYVVSVLLWPVVVPYFILKDFLNS